ncbi:hypothetical protein I4U23_019592 [Adineta vaga]|nr:hypothetical protein I4U23_019592 [Adineta vaga]
MSDTRRVVYRSAPKDRDPVYVPVYEPGYSQPTIIRSADAVTPRTNVPASSRVVVVRNQKNPQVEQAPIYVDDYSRPVRVDNDSNKQVYVVRRPAGVQNTAHVLSPDRAPPVYIDNPQTYAPQVIRTRPRSRSPSPGHAYYSQSAPRVEQYHNSNDDYGCFPCCPDSSSDSRDRGYNSSGTSVKTSLSHRILNFFYKHTCLIIIIALIVLIIAIICVIICGVFLGLYPSSNYGLKIAGIVLGSILAVGTIIFLFFMLCCLGQEEGFFSYFGKRPRIGGQAYALMPPPSTLSYPQPTSQVYAVPGQRPANVVYRSAIPNGYETRSNKNNVVVRVDQ